MNRTAALDGPTATPFAELRRAIVVFVALTVATGLAYPLLVTAVAATLFPDAARGSVIERDGVAVGSTLIGQSFTAQKYFWGRPSATAPLPNTAFNSATLTGSSGSNLGPTNPALADAVAARVAALDAADEAVGLQRPASRAIPIDLVAASASGLDPEISVAAATYQLPRVARARGMAEDLLGDLVRRHTLGRTFGVLGEPRVNVLELNLALDAISPPTDRLPSR